jgi:glycosyltransferase involved in cell wall biosynthesis
MTKITAIIPTLNEEIHIEEAIKSVDFAEEIIIIDSYSTDRTLELAEKNYNSLPYGYKTCCSIFYSIFY